MFMCVVNLESVNKLDLTWKQSFLIELLRNFQMASLLDFFSGESLPLHFWKAVMDVLVN